MMALVLRHLNFIYPFPILGSCSQPCPTGPRYPALGTRHGTDSWTWWTIDYHSLNLPRYLVSVLAAQKLSPLHHLSHHKTPPISPSSVPSSVHRTTTSSAKLEQVRETKGVHAKAPPPELISIVLEHLPPESVVAFALTCRALFIYFPRPAQLSDLARATLLQWLKQDILDLFFCHNCPRLHLWRLIRCPRRGDIWVCMRDCRRTPYAMNLVGLLRPGVLDEPYLLSGPALHQPPSQWASPRPIYTRYCGNYTK